MSAPKEYVPIFCVIIEIVVIYVCCIAGFFQGGNFAD